MQINLHGVTKIEVSSLFLAPMDGFCRFSKWKTITIHCEDGTVKVNVFFSQDEHDSTVGEQK